MISIIPVKSARDELRIQLNDPFQLATPCWAKRTWSQLPPETVKTVNDKEIHMPITRVAASSIPARPSRVGAKSSIPEIAEVVEAIKTMKPNEAIKVELSAETNKRLAEKKTGKKQVPAKALVVLLRRKFKSLGVSYTAYTSDSKEVFVIKEAK